MPQKIHSPETLGAVLRQERKKRQMSQTAVGRTVGIDQPTMSRVEKGNPGTELGTLFRLLAALDLELTVQERQHLDDEPKGDTW